MKATFLAALLAAAVLALASTVLDAQHKIKLRQAATACAIESSGTDMDTALCFTERGLPVPEDI